MPLSRHGSPLLQETFPFLRTFFQARHPRHARLLQNCPCFYQKRKSLPLIGFPFANHPESLSLYRRVLLRCCVDFSASHYGMVMRRSLGQTIEAFLGVHICPGVAPLRGMTLIVSRQRIVSPFPFRWRLLLCRRLRGCLCDFLVGACTVFMLLSFGGLD